MTTRQTLTEVWRYVIVWIPSVVIFTLHAINWMASALTTLFEMYNNSMNLKDFCSLTTLVRKGLVIDLLVNL